jgi:hypothetical protein
MVDLSKAVVKAFNAWKNDFFLKIWE